MQNQQQQVNHELNAVIYEATIKDLGTTIGDLNIQLSISNSKIEILSKELEKANQMIQEMSNPETETFKDVEVMDEYK